MFGVVGYRVEGFGVLGFGSYGFGVEGFRFLWFKVGFRIEHTTPFTPHHSLLLTSFTDPPP